ncbi:MAG: hemerythrin domain-containing protein [Magnetovibrionaceae bacterium]
MSAIKLLSIPEALLMQFTAIDREHEAILDIINDGLEQMAEDRLENFPLHFCRFNRCLAGHFRSEEAIMDRYAYPLRHVHSDHHRLAMKQMEAVARRCTAQGFAERADLLELFDRLMHDIVNQDLDFHAFLLNEGRVRDGSPLRVR